MLNKYIVFLSFVFLFYLVFDVSALCEDSDGGKDLSIKGTCKDDSGGTCDRKNGGCTDACGGSYTGYDYYCSGAISPDQQTCFIEYFDCGKDPCSDGACKSGSDGSSSATGCAYYASNFGICSGGCPPSYLNEVYVCCDSIGYSECGGRTACASYNPLKGESPCCNPGGYQTCSSEETCTENGCVSVCDTEDKTSELYCSKCNSCQDGIQNCGEPSVDRCGEACTVPKQITYNTPGSYGGYTCSEVGNNKCQIYNDPYCVSGGCYDVSCSKLVSCSYDQYGCVWQCLGTIDVFNQASCSDGIQNCDETCVDGGSQCNAGTKETDNSYAVSFDFTEPITLTGTKLYVDMVSWNCMDGKDNDRDCAVDCEDSDCISAIACTDTTSPTVTVAGAPINWAVSATANVGCSDDISGCDSDSYLIKIYNSNPGTCPIDYNQYTQTVPKLVADPVWVCATAKDNNGNIGYSRPVEFKVDDEPPQVIVTPIKNPISSEDVEIFEVICADSKTACNATTIFMDSYSCVVNHTNDETNCSIAFKNSCDNNDYVYTTDSTDIAGNSNSSVSGVIKVKKKDGCNCVVSNDCFSGTCLSNSICEKIEAPEIDIVGGFENIQMELGEKKIIYLTVKNLINANDLIDINVYGDPADIKYWSYFEGQKYTNRTHKQVYLESKSELTIPIIVFGGKVGTYNLIFEVKSNLNNFKSKKELNVRIFYVNEKGIVVKSPGLGLSGILTILLFAVILVTRRRIR